MNIGLKIKELRTNNNMKQEALAEVLGVSVQAISRWENDVTYPDITLLPIIANTFQVSVDELLGVDLLKIEEEIKEILEKDDKLQDDHHKYERFEFLKKKIKKYPNNFSLKYRWFCANWELTRCHDDDNLNHKFALETIRIGEDLLKKCEDDEIRWKIIELLVYTYGYLGLDNDEYHKKALELVNKSPTIFATKELLMDHVVKTKEEWHECAKKHIKDIVWWLKSTLEMMQICLTPEQNIKAWNIYLNFVKSIYEDKDFGWTNVGLKICHLNLAKSYAKLKDKDETIKHLEIAYNYAKAYDNLPNVSVHTSFLVCGIKEDKKNLTFSEKNQIDWFKDMLNNEIFDFIKDSKEFNKLKNK